MGFKNIYQDIIRSPATLITTLAAVAIVGYVLYKSNSSNTASTTGTSSNGQYFVAMVPDAIPGPPGNAGPPGPPGPTPNPTQCPPGFHWQASVDIKSTNPPVTPTGHCVPNDSVSGITFKLRLKTPKDKAQGINIYASPGGKIARTASYGSNVLVTGISQEHSGKAYFPINQGGFVLEQDLVGIS